MCTGYSLVPCHGLKCETLHFTLWRNLNQTRVGDWKTSWLHCSLKSGEKWRKVFPAKLDYCELIYLGGLNEKYLQHCPVPATQHCPQIYPGGDKESPLTMAQNLLASLHFRRLLMEICNWNVIVSKLSRFVWVLTWEVALGYEATKGGRMLRRRYYSNHWKCASSVCSPD